MPPRRNNTMPGGGAPTGGDMGPGGIMDTSGIPVARPGLPEGFPQFPQQANQQIDFGVGPTGGQRPGAQRPPQRPGYGPPGSHPPTMPMDDYNVRSFNSAIQETGQRNQVQFNNAVMRVQTSMQTARADAEQRRARGEQVGEPYPGVTNEMLQDISREYAASNQRLQGRIQALYQQTPNGAPPDRRWLQQQTDLLSREHANAFQRHIHERHGQAGDIALQAISQQGEEPGMLGGFLNKLSSPGGIIGAVGLGALAFFGLGGMEGGIMSIIGALVGVIGGTFLGNSVGNMISGPSAPDVPRGPVVAGGPGQGQAVQPPGVSSPGLTTGNLTPSPGPARPYGTDISIT